MSCLVYEFFAKLNVCASRKGCQPGLAGSKYARMFVKPMSNIKQGYAHVVD